MYYRFTVMTLVVLTLMLAGCSTTAPSSFYLLSPMPAAQPSQKTPQPSARLVIGVGPVEIPAYLNRPQIVTRVSPNQLNLSEFERWAEPMEDSVSRILLQNLSKLLQAQAYTFQAWTGSSSFDYKVPVELIRFDGQAGGDAVLVAQWSIYDGKDNKMITSARANIEKQASGPAVVNMVEAQSQALEELSRQIASAIAKLN